MHLRTAEWASLLALLLTSGCGGVIALGAVTEVGDQYRANECARVLQLAEESSRFLAEYPYERAEVYLYKAKCLARMDRRDEAKAAFLYVIEQHGDTPFAYDAQAFLEQLQREEQQERPRPREL